MKICPILYIGAICLIEFHQFWPDALVKKPVFVLFKHSSIIDKLRIYKTILRKKIIILVYNILTSFI